MKKTWFLYFSLIVCCGIATARWSTEEDAASRYELRRSFIKVKKDGTFTKEEEIKVTLLKESAVGSFGNYYLTYNGQAQKIEILSAKSVAKGKEFPVDLKLIEDKPLASSPRGFDQIRQVLIVFPRLQVGSVLYIHYRRHFKVVPFKDFFSYFYNFSGRFLTHREITVESERPLFYKINNPGQLLKVSYRAHKRKRKYIFKVTLRRPIFKTVVDEGYPFINPNLFPWIEVSTTTKWPRMVKSLGSQYEKIIEAPLPKMHKTILKSVQKIPTGPEDQIEFVISSLIGRIRYFRDWKAINGGYVPRSLSVIAETGFGDCKDLSVSLAAILRKIGFTAHVGFIQRGGWRHSLSDFTLPNGGAFNHAIVLAEKAGKVFWLDPTNKVSYARGLFPDIVDRQVLVLKKPRAILLRTPKINSKGAEYKITRNFKITNTKEIRVTGAIDFKGRGAISFTGASLYKSKESLDYDFIQFTGVDTASLKEWKVEGYDLSSRIVKDFSVKISYSMRQNSHPFNFLTQLGPIFAFPRWGRVNAFDIRVRDRVSDLYLGQPYRAVMISKLKNIEPVGNSEFNCNFQSPWADFKRSVVSLQPFTVEDIYDFKLPWISSRELKSSKFRRLQKNIRNCFKNFLMVYKKSG
ncbi:MAG: DUF3857 domain-containing protein [Bdellovibrionales bacterium]|nr:DUF3857 domain-containing protein [Bdellovibrionales bacterium]